MKRRIAFIQSGLGAGGAEKIINLLAKHRAKHGDEVFVVSFHDRPEDSYFTFPKSVTVRTMVQDGHTVKLGWKGFMQQIKWLRKCLKEIQPELVISFLSKINVISTFALIGQKSFFLVSERNNPLKQRSGKIWRTLIGYMFHRADRIVMQTCSAKEILSHKTKTKAYVIPNPSLVVPHKQSNKTSSQQLVSVGRLTHQKGFDLLIQAFSDVIKVHPNAKLTIWGEGEERTNLEQLTKDLGLHKHISLPGNTSKPLQWINSAKIFIMPSRYEGFPNALSEAMMAGIASISFDCPWGPSELIKDGHNGILVSPEDINALSKEIINLIGNEGLQSHLGKNAQKNSEIFSINPILNKWDKVFDFSQNQSF